ncbi:MAG: 2-amino-4-hydroxy-6-hydroxymethyldihydropteridine diphosphokinase [Pseudomonadota bacterium]
MILIALGSNSPFRGQPPLDVVRNACVALSTFAEVTARSRLYRSAAWPHPEDPPFVNAVAAVKTDMTPERLLSGLHDIENAFGRVRRPDADKRYGPRTLDLDLLDYQGRLRSRDSESPLVLPHPRLVERRFVLAPLNDIAPEWRHPETGQTLRQLLAAAPADDSVTPLDAGWSRA